MSLRELHEKQQNHSELRKWYLTLWSSLLNQRDADGVSAKEGLEIFRKYVAVLVKVKDTYAAIRIARELRAVCLAEFGASDLSSIQAAMELAALLEKDAGSHEEAVSLYEDICKFSKEASHDHDLLLLIRSARARLAHLLATQSDLAHRAEMIYMQDWEEAGNVFGYGSEETLTALAKLVAFFRKDHARRYTTMAIKKIEENVPQIITHEQDLRKLFVSAEAIARMYMDMNAYESAFVLLRRIRADISARFGVGFLPNSMWIDRRWTVFATALEKILRKQASSTLFTDLISELFVESTLYESWLRVLQTKATFETRISVGGRLLALLGEKHRHLEIGLLKDELWGVFRDELSPESPKSSAIWELFQVCATEMSRERSAATLLETAVQVVADLCEATKHQQALELASWIKEHVWTRGGFKEQGLGSLGMKLSICLINASDLVMGSELAMALQRLSMDILSETMLDQREVEFDMSPLSIRQINVYIRLLGTQKNYSLLEQILQTLWTSRTHQTWAINTTISIGRRLSKVKFALGKHTEALSIVGDICYNVSDMLGPTHHITLACDRLHAALNKRCGNHAAAIDVHTRVLRKITAYGGGGGGGEDHNGAGMSRDEIVAVSVRELRSLKTMYMCGGWGNRDPASVVELSRQLFDRMGELDVEAEALADVAAWDLEAADQAFEVEDDELEGTEGQLDFGIEEAEGEEGDEVHDDISVSLGESYPHDW
ncbi:hypothetical protein MMC25_006925 [Agyrium rufum]|nr:hypothetical protein [Agyrium rufum]